MTYTDQNTLESQLYALADLLTAGCDPGFDTMAEDLEREFAELRLQLASFE